MDAQGVQERRDGEARWSLWLASPMRALPVLGRKFLAGKRFKMNEVAGTYPVPPRRSLLPYAKAAA